MVLNLVTIPIRRSSVAECFSEYLDLLEEYNIQINIDVDDAKKALQYARTVI